MVEAGHSQVPDHSLEEEEGLEEGLHNLGKIVVVAAVAERYVSRFRSLVEVTFTCLRVILARWRTWK